MTASKSALGAIAATLTLLPLTALATGSFDPAAAQRVPSARWERTERLVDPDPHMIAERFIPLVEHKLPEIVAAFAGDPSPPSSTFLLHYTRGWDRPTNGVPVLLIPGAGVTANHCYADHPFEQPYPGLAAHLAATGRAVFAITFAHTHGDNVLQAEAVADAIARIKHVTGAALVDLVAHSKGGMAARIYLSDAGLAWTTRYRGDVRRYVMLGTPNGGLDFPFAYPNLTYSILAKSTPAPLVWTQGLYWGRWVRWRERTLYAGGAFPGQSQMLRRWDARYGRTGALGQADPVTTYEGGRGLVSVSLGIDQAIQDGGDFMRRLRAKPVASGVELAVLAGSRNVIMNQVGERRGPSDGLLFVASALDVAPMLRGGARLVRLDLLELNHLELVYAPAANVWVVDALAP